jgi:hypothetical protein
MSDDESSAGQGTARDSVLAGASRDHRRQLQGRGLCADTGSGGRKARSSPAARFGRRLISEYPDWGTFVPLSGNAGLNTQVRGALTRLGLLAYERNFNGMTSRRAQPSFPMSSSCTVRMFSAAFDVWFRQQNRRFVSRRRRQLGADNKVGDLCRS